MSWWVSAAATRLRQQANQVAPNRSKVSDGTIGNAEHSARTSDHNPRPDGEVCALDLTNDPAGGLDAHRLARETVDDPRVKYCISNGRIKSKRFRLLGWRPYFGRNRHKSHAHWSFYPNQPGTTWRAAVLGTASLISPAKDWFDMATEDDLRRVVRDENTRSRNATLAFLTQVIKDQVTEAKHDLMRWTAALAEQIKAAIAKK